MPEQTHVKHNTRRWVAFAVVPVVGLLAAGVYLSLHKARPPKLATGARYPLEMRCDPSLWSAPRPSPLPVYYEEGMQFHRRLVQLPEGGLALLFVDAFLPAGTQPLVIKRQYRSGLDREGVFGRGWASNLDVRLEMTANGELRIVEADGRVTSYVSHSPDHYVQVAGPFLKHTLVHEKSGRFIREWAYGTREVFDKHGRLQERGDNTDKLKLSYSHESSHQPSEIGDSAGHVVKLSYQDGLLVEVSDPLKRTVRYAYRQRHLTEVTDAIGRRTSFAYANGKMSEMILPGQEKLSFNYTPDGALGAVSGPVQQQTTFGWQVDKKSASVKLTATSSTGAVETLDIAPAAVNPADWGISASHQRLAVQLRRVAASGQSSTALVLDDRVLVSAGGGQWVLDPSRNFDLDGASSDPPSLPAADLDEWRARFTPAKTPSGDPQIKYDNAGRPVDIALDPNRRESWSWDAADRIVEWKGAAGDVTRYTTNRSPLYLAIGAPRLVVLPNLSSHNSVWAQFPSVLGQTTAGRICSRRSAGWIRSLSENRSSKHDKRENPPQTMEIGRCCADHRNPRMWVIILMLSPFDCTPSTVWPGGGSHFVSFKIRSIMGIHLGTMLRKS